MGRVPTRRRVAIMAVTHTGGEMSPLHYLALARDADGVELGDRENLKALFDAGLSGDETTLYMRVRIHPDGKLVAEPCQPQDISLPWALGDDLFVINLSNLGARDGAFVLVECWYCPENQELIEHYSTVQVVQVPELLSVSGPVSGIDLVWSSLSNEATRQTVMQTVIELAGVLKEIGEH